MPCLLTLAAPSSLDEWHRYPVYTEMVKEVVIPLNQGATIVLEVIPAKKVSNLTAECIELTMPVCYPKEGGLVPWFLEGGPGYPSDYSTL